MNREELISLALKYEGNYRRMYQAIKQKEKVEERRYEGNALTILDERYPKELLELKEPPLVLFYEGDLSLLNSNKIAVVGSRTPSRYGKSVTERICQTLSGSITLISGMAKGIDALVHKSCLPFGKTIGVLGCGIDYIYPWENEKLYAEMKLTQLLLSEYPAKIPPYKYNFPFRNRIIAALGKVLIVTEASMKSGTFLTVNEALNLNRDVYVVPYPLIDEISGCNYLIQQGANILCEFSEVEKLQNLFDKDQTLSL